MAHNNKVKVGIRGEDILDHPRWNKGTAFTVAERQQFGLCGRLPVRVNTLEQQCDRAYDQLESHATPLQQNSFLQSLKNQNWVLYYSLLSKHLKELIPIIYTPTEADAIANYSTLFRRSEGLFLSYPHKDCMEEDFLEQIKGRDIDLVVCSDAEAILGIGDQGVGGIGISTAKSTIYTLVGGVDPSKTLPVTFDVGTNNKDLLNDHLYVGWPHERLRGAEYDEFIDKFVQLVRKHLPHSLLHFEDFGVTNALRLLDRYRPQHAVFNDDVQGTGTAALATLLAAVKILKSKLSQQRIIVFGAGSAGLGIATVLRDAMVTDDGVTKEEANKQFWLIDKYGLCREGLGDQVRPELKEFVKPDAPFASVAKKDQGGNVDLKGVIDIIHPTVLIGTSTCGGAFTEDIVKAMAAHTERPVIFPLSNPSRLAEAKPADILAWTEGRAIVATGSPFPDVKVGDKEFIIAECNNALIYPGIGLGAIVARATEMTDGMLFAAAHALALLSPALAVNRPNEPNAEDDVALGLLPDFEHAQAVNLEVSIAVAKAAVAEGVAAANYKEEEIRKIATERAWRPVYQDYEYDPQGEV